MNPAPLPSLSSLFAPSGGPSAPVLSAATAINITATTVTPRVNITI